LSSVEVVSVGDLLCFECFVRGIESDSGASTKGLFRCSIGLNRVSSALISSGLACDGGTPITTV
jgi:hypothetical protein